MPVPEESFEIDTLEPDEPIAPWWEPIEEVVKGPYNRVSDTMIDCVVVHPSLGDIPFSASSEDSEELGREAYKYAATQL